MLTDEKIAAIAKPYIQYIGTHWIYDKAIPEDAIVDFVREVIQEDRRQEDRRQELEDLRENIKALRGKVCPYGDVDLCECIHIVNRINAQEAQK